jgi:hypothetical protein
MMPSRASVGNALRSPRIAAMLRRAEAISLRRLREQIFGGHTRDQGRRHGCAGECALDISRHARTASSRRENSPALARSLRACEAAIKVAVRLLIGQRRRIWRDIRHLPYPTLAAISRTCMPDSLSSPRCWLLPLPDAPRIAPATPARSIPRTRSGIRPRLPTIPAIRSRRRARSLVLSVRIQCVSTRVVLRA